VGYFVSMSATTTRSVFTPDCETRRSVGPLKLDRRRRRRSWDCRALVVYIIATSGGRRRSDLCLRPKRAN
jgi:hypothetical protein